ncbi:putative 2-haloalkanoic acid dehalogenase [Venturia nashicola]|uniref:Putative 2-haloalkanoic acid dehalogenase n=1 Tax=Venturia nashicola TaxID=86259 RepID=A0A4Z1PSE2_9PEZI|nr:putative 2-haloalkanoic acid dehalogenase [Venturia nashicola]
MPPKHVVFDVVGTCVSFTAYYTKIAKTIGPKLQKHNINPQAFGYAWMTAAELEFTFLSLSARYKPYKTIFAALFYRTLHMMGVPLSAQKTDFSDEERDACIQGYSELELRDGLADCFAVLRSAGFTVWCLTTGDISRVRGYFTRGGVDMPVENFITCDSTGVAKPALASYKPALEKFGEGEERWFAAAHMWDVSAAVKAGFRGAYCTVYEEYACEEIFEEKMEVVEGDLVGMAREIVRKTVA